jgi:hypothetical protein
MIIAIMFAVVVIPVLMEIPVVIIPGLLADSHYVFFKGMSLKTIAALSGGQLTSTTLNQTAADLASLHKIASLGQ